MAIYASLKCAVAVFLSSIGNFFARDLGEIPPGGEIFRRDLGENAHRGGILERIWGKIPPKLIHTPYNTGGISGRHLGENPPRRGEMFVRDLGGNSPL